MKLERETKVIISVIFLLATLFMIDTFRLSATAPVSLEHQVMQQYATVNLAWNYSEGIWCADAQRIAKSQFVTVCGKDTEEVYRQLLEK